MGWVNHKHAMARTDFLGVFKWDPAKPHQVSGGRVTWRDGPFELLLPTPTLPPAWDASEIVAVTWCIASNRLYVLNGCNQYLRCTFTQLTNPVYDVVNELPPVSEVEREPVFGIIDTTKDPLDHAILRWVQPDVKRAGFSTEFDWPLGRKCVGVEFVIKDSYLAVHVDAQKSLAGRIAVGKTPVLNAYLSNMGAAVVESNIYASLQTVPISVATTLSMQEAMDWAMQTLDMEVAPDWRVVEIETMIHDGDCMFAAFATYCNDTGIAESVRSSGHGTPFDASAVRTDVANWIRANPDKFVDLLPPSDKKRPYIAQEFRPEYAEAKNIDPIKDAWPPLLNATELAEELDSSDRKRKPWRFYLVSEDDNSEKTAMNSLREVERKQFAGDDVAEVFDAMPLILCTAYNVKIRLLQMRYAGDAFQNPLLDIQPHGVDKRTLKHTVYLVHTHAQDHYMVPRLKRVAYQVVDDEEEEEEEEEKEEEATAAAVAVAVKKKKTAAAVDKRPTTRYLGLFTIPDDVKPVMTEDTIIWTDEKKGMSLTTPVTKTAEAGGKVKTLARTGLRQIEIDLKNNMVVGRGATAKTVHSARIGVFSSNDSDALFGLFKSENPTVDKEQGIYTWKNVKLAAAAANVQVSGEAVASITWNVARSMLMLTFEDGEWSELQMQVGMKGSKKVWPDVKRPNTITPVTLGGAPRQAKKKKPESESESEEKAPIAPQPPASDAAKKKKKQKTDADAPQSATHSGLDRPRVGVMDQAGRGPWVERLFEALKERDASSSSAVGDWIGKQSEKTPHGRFIKQHFTELKTENFDPLKDDTVMSIMDERDKPPVYDSGRHRRLGVGWRRRDITSYTQLVGRLSEMDVWAKFGAMKKRNWTIWNAPLNTDEEHLALSSLVHEHIHTTYKPTAHHVIVLTNKTFEGMWKQLGTIHPVVLDINADPAQPLWSQLLGDRAPWKHRMNTIPYFLVTQNALFEFMEDERNLDLELKKLAEKFDKEVWHLDLSPGRLERLRDDVVKQLRGYQNAPKEQIEFLRDLFIQARDDFRKQCLELMPDGKQEVWSTVEHKAKKPGKAPHTKPDLDDPVGIAALAWVNEDAAEAAEAAKRAGVKHTPDTDKVKEHKIKMRRYDVIVQEFLDARDVYIDLRHLILETLIPFDTLAKLDEDVERIRKKLGAAKAATVEDAMEVDDAAEPMEVEGDEKDTNARLHAQLDAIQRSRSNYKEKLRSYWESVDKNLDGTVKARAAEDIRSAAAELGIPVKIKLVDLFAFPSRQYQPIDAQHGIPWRRLDEKRKPAPTNKGRLVDLQALFIHYHRKAMQFLADQSPIKLLQEAAGGMKKHVELIVDFDVRWKDGPKDAIHRSRRIAELVEVVRQTDSHHIHIIPHSSVETIDEIATVLTILGELPPSRACSIGGAFVDVFGMGARAHDYRKRSTPITMDLASFKEWSQAPRIWELKSPARTRLIVRREMFPVRLVNWVQTPSDPPLYIKVSERRDAPERAALALWWAWQLEGRMRWCVFHHGDPLDQLPQYATLTDIPFEDGKEVEFPLALLTKASQLIRVAEQARPTRDLDAIFQYVGWQDLVEWQKQKLKAINEHTGVQNGVVFKPTWRFFHELVSSVCGSMKVLFGHDTEAIAAPSNKQTIPIAAQIVGVAHLSRALMAGDSSPRALMSDDSLSRALVAGGSAQIEEVEDD